MTDSIDSYFSAHAAYQKKQQRSRSTGTETKRKHPESVEQVAFFRRVRLSEKRYPILRLVIAVPNTAGLLQKKQNPKTGHWYCPQGSRLRAEGLQPGAPDILALFPRGGQPYLAIEMKSRSGVLSDEQSIIRDAMLQEGARYEVCRSADAAWGVLMNYLSLGGEVT